MATVVDRPGGHRWVQFKGLAGRRHTIRLGKVSRAHAMDFKHRVERLLSAVAMGQPPDLETSRWVGTLSSNLHAKLSAVGLVDRRAASTLGDLIEDFFASVSAKDATIRNLSIAAGNLRQFFGARRSIHAITPADARRFRAWLLASGGAKGGPLASTTVSRRIGRVKQLFTHGVQAGALQANPFAGEARGNEANRSRDFFVTSEIIAAILEQAPDAEFRAIIALARYGGLRCPAEVLPLRWQAVDWGRDILRVGSPKLEHHAGQGQRDVPLFPEVRQALDDLWHHDGEAGELLFPHYQVSGWALTKKLWAVCRKAGIEPWRKAFQNMRSTRVSEINDHFPAMVASAWLGHSPGVARKHYYQLAKEHVERALTFGLKSEAKPEAPNPHNPD